MKNINLKSSAKTAESLWLAQKFVRFWPHDNKYRHRSLLINKLRGLNTANSHQDTSDMAQLNPRMLAIDPALDLMLSMTGRGDLLWQCISQPTSVAATLDCHRWLQREWRRKPRLAVADSGHHLTNNRAEQHSFIEYAYNNAKSRQKKEISPDNN